MELCGSGVQCCGAVLRLPEIVLRAESEAKSSDNLPVERRAECCAALRGGAKGGWGEGWIRLGLDGLRRGAAQRDAAVGRSGGLTLCGRVCAVGRVMVRGGACDGAWRGVGWWAVGNE